MNRLRCAFQRVGLDVNRYPVGTPAWRRVTLMEHHGVSVLFDVGANDGGYVRECRRLGFSGRVVSFEPVSAVRERLKESSSKDPLWSVEPWAIGRDFAQVTINVAGNAGASSSIRPMLDLHRRVAPASVYVHEERVEQRPLRSVWRDHADQADRAYLKVDVQGYEGEVLSGLGDFLEICTGLQVEASLTPLYEDDFTLEDTLAFAADNGFAVFAVEPGFSDKETGRMLQADVVLYRS